MKKYIIILILSLVSIPTIAMASWWNPFTWSVFSKVVNVELKLNNPDTSSSVSSSEINITATTTENEIVNLKKEIKQLKDQQIKKTTLIKNVPQKTATSSLNNNIVFCNGQRFNDNCSSFGKKLFCGPDGHIGCYSQGEMDAIKICNGKSYNTSSCTLQRPFYCPSKGEAYCQDTDQEHNGLQANFDKIKTQEQMRLKEEVDRKSSSECINAKASYDDINRQIQENRNLTSKYNLMSNEASDLISKGADLSIKSVSIRDKYYLACENYVSAPPKMYNTNCQIYGNSAECTTY